MGIFRIVKRSPVAFVLACVAAMTMVALSEAAYWRSARTLTALTSVDLARTNIERLGRGVVDAETGQRGYLLSGRRDDREPYDKALGEIEQSLQALERYYAGAPRPRDVLARLREQTTARLNELALTMRLHEEGQRKATTEILLSDVGKQQMDTIRARSAELLRLEAANVEAQREELSRTLLLNRLGVAMLSAVSVLALSMYLRKTAALERQQREQHRLMQSERDRLEGEVAQRTQQLTELTRHLQTAREDERSRLARDLHDELGALLTSAKLDAARIKSRLGVTAPEALERLGHLVTALNNGIALKRRIIEDLRPSTLGNLGLTPTLEILARDFGERSGIPVHTALEAVKLDSTVDLVIYRVVQEALTNIAKYAKAKQVWLTLAADPDQLHVSVRDDGVGFDSSAAPNGHGLVGMRFRVEAEGGTLHVQSAPGQGTVVRVVLPLLVPA